MFLRLNLPLNSFRKQCYKFRRQCYKFRRQCYDGVGNMSGQRACVAKRIQELQPGQSNHILKATRWMWQRAACWSKAPCRVDAMSTSHEDIKLIKYSPQKEDIFRRINENIGLPGDSGRIVWAALFTFNPYLLISINELLISIIHLLISINELLISINEL